MLQLIKKYEAERVFEPGELAVLVAAFDEAWAQIVKSGARFHSEYRREEARNTLGKFIIDEAKRGERDIARLRDGALLHYANPHRRK
jgi:hypothetical protein